MSANITIKDRLYYSESNIGAIICHTPKCIDSIDAQQYITTHSCHLINNVDDLEKYYGDPYINPALYSDLIIAYKIVKAGIPMYVSSVYDMFDNSDGFEKIKYNGYTKFYFKENGFPVVGYKLKSEYKFCQPIIQKLDTSNNDNVINIYVKTYYVDTTKKKDLYTINSIDPNRLYNIIKFSYDIDTLNDSILISDFYNHDLELQVIYQNSNNTALTEQLIKHAKLATTILTDFDESEDDHYTNSLYEYWLNTKDYKYYFDDDNIIINSYNEAIVSLSKMNTLPQRICFGTLYKSNKSNDNLSESLISVDPETQISIYNILLSTFDNESDTYLFINMPDLSVSSSLKLLNSESTFSNVPQLLENYNCDLFFGYITEYVESTLYNKLSRKVNYSSALLSFCNLLLGNYNYMTNNFISLNIANMHIKLILTENSANKLKENRCNSIVLFDIDAPSTYGNRSLSLLPNLRFSNVSRNFVYLRRVIREYLETRKFTLNTMYNIDATIGYIKVNILDELVSQGILSNYTISYTTSHKTVKILISLTFYSVLESISLDFTIN